MANDLSTYAGRQAERDQAASQGRTVVVDASGVYDRGSGQTSAGSSGGGGQGASTSSPAAVAASAPAGSYQTKNGVKTPQQMYDELMKAGWNGVGEIKAKYAETTGGAVVPGGNSPGAGGVPGAPVLPPVPPGVQTPEQLEKWKAEILAGFKESSGFSREELAEKRRQFDATMAQTEAQWLREGVPLLEIKQRLMVLEETKYKSDLELAKRAQTVSEGNLGLDYLKTASSMGGPADYFNSVDFNRGAAARGDVPMFLNALASNTALPSFTSAGQVAQNPMTAAGLAGKLTGAPVSTAGYNPDQALAQIGSIFKSGGTGLAAGSLERLDPAELELLKAGGQKLGYDPDAWLRTYSKSGVGQSAGVV